MPHPYNQEKAAYRYTSTENRKMSSGNRNKFRKPFFHTIFVLSSMHNNILKNKPNPIPKYPIIHEIPNNIPKTEIQIQRKNTIS